MCGQCGIYTGFISSNEMRFFQKLLLLNQDRGVHSTGVVTVTKPRDEHVKGRKRHHPAQLLVWKEPRCAYDFLMYDDLDKKKKKDRIFGGAPKQLIFGHCRHATVGKINSENAHPFEVGEIVGVHNGTIKIPFDGHKDYETDSEGFFALINKVGLRQALQEVESWANTAYAIVFLNKRESTLNIVRNADRPLKMVYNRSKNLLAWSSEGIDILYAAAKKGIDINSADIFEPKPYQHYEFNLNDPLGYLSPKVTDLTPKKTTYSSTSTQSSQNGWVGAGHTEFSYWNENGERYRKRNSTGIVYVWVPSGTPLIGSGDWKYIGYEGKFTETDTCTPDCVEEGERFKDLPPFIQNPPKPSLPERVKSFVNITEAVPFEGGKQVIFLGFQGQQHMLKQFEELMMQGCSVCQVQPQIENNLDIKIGWSDRNHFFCEECMQNPVVVKNMVRWTNKAADQTPAEDI